MQYVLGKRTSRLPSIACAARPAPSRSAARIPRASRASASPPTEWKRIGAIVVFFLFATLFWGAYEQAGSTLNLFADRYTRHEVFGFYFPSSWFQPVQPSFVILLAPVFAWLWLRLGRREPSSPAKFALGLLVRRASRSCCSSRRRRWPRAARACASARGG